MKKINTLGSSVRIMRKISCILGRYYARTHSEYELGVLNSVREFGVSL